MTKRANPANPAGQKTILVTGATSGIGLALVRQLDQAGHRLLLVGRSAEALAQLQGSLQQPGTALPADLADSTQLAALAAQLPERIDGFVHAAGMESVVPLRMVNYDKFDYLMRLHLYSFVEIVRQIERNKKKDADYLTSVVALSSVASDGGGVGQTMYAASKAALEAAVRVLAKELAPKRIRLNAIKPGIVDTAMTRRWMRRIGIADAAEVDSLQLNGMAQPEEIVALIEFLLSDLSRHIVGTQIKIDGGGPTGKVF